MIDPSSDPRLDAALRTQGPLPSDVAADLVHRGQARLEAGEPQLAIPDFRRVVGHDDPVLTGAALVGMGDAAYRLDHEADALQAWEAATQVRENPSTYRAWRNIAGARVRTGDLTGAIDAYREADRRAPAEDKAEIASRLGWLAKETGNRAPRAGTSRAVRGATGLGVTGLIIIATVVVSFLAFESEALFRALWLDRASILAGRAVPAADRHPRARARDHDAVVLAPPAVQHVRAVHRRADRRVDLGQPPDGPLLRPDRDRGVDRKLPDLGRPERRRVGRDLRPRRRDHRRHPGPPPDARPAGALDRPPARDLRR